MCQMAPSALGTNGQRPEPLFCSSQLPVPTVGASRKLPEMSENHSLAATWDRSTTEAQMRELSQFLSSPVFYSSKSFSVPVGKLGVVFLYLSSCSPAVHPVQLPRCAGGGIWPLPMKYEEIPPKYTTAGRRPRMPVQWRWSPIIHFNPLSSLLKFYISRDISG